MLGKQKESENILGEMSRSSEIDPGRIRTLHSYVDKRVEPKRSLDFSPEAVREAVHPMTGGIFSSLKKEVSNEKVNTVVPKSSPFYKAEESLKKQQTVGKDSPNSAEKRMGGMKEMNVEKNVAPIPDNVLKQPFEKISDSEHLENKQVEEYSLNVKIEGVKDVNTGQSLEGNEAGNTVNPSEEKNGVAKVFFVVFVVALFVLALWGGYLYWESRMASVSQEAIPVVTDLSKNSGSEKKEASSFPYEKKISNSIIINESNGKTVLAEMKKAIDIFARSQNEGVLEFFFVDEEKNFNAILEKNFLQRMGIAFSARMDSLVRDSDEGRMYLVKNGSDVRVVLAVPVTSRDAFLAAMLQSEGELLKTIAPMYFSGVSIEGIVPKFSDQTYQGYAIRYFNIDISKNYSLDYTFRRDTLYLGTSRQSLRDVVNSLDGKEKSFSARNDSSDAETSEKK